MSLVIESTPANGPVPISSSVSAVVVLQDAKKKLSDEPSNEKDVCTVNDTASLEAGDADEFRKGTIPGSIANIVNTIVGAGILALPAQFNELGWALCIVVMSLSALGSAFGLNLLSSCAHKIGGENTSFGMVAAKTYPKIAWLVDLAVFVTTFGGAASYLIVVGDLMPAVCVQIGAAATSLWASRHVWTTAAFVVIGVPLTCLRNLAPLRFTSYISVACILYCLILVILFFSQPSDTINPCLNTDGSLKVDCQGNVKLFTTNPLSFFRALPTFAFAFACHYNIFPVYNEIRKPTMTRMNIVIYSSVPIVTFLYLSFGLLGYLTYGDKVPSNILVAYPELPLVSAARILVSLFVTFSYPLMTHPSRQALIHILEVSIHKYKPEALTNPKLHKMIFWGMTVFVCGLSYLVAMLTNDLGKVFALVGATASTAVTFTFPGLYYWKLFTWEEGRMKRWGALIMLVFGALLTPCAVAAVFI